jgi:hypothetical protein
MGGIFSSPKAPAQSPAIDAGIARREKEAADAELREKKASALRRRRLMGGMGLGSGLMPEELQSPLASQTKLGIDRNPQ